MNMQARIPLPTYDGNVVFIGPTNSEIQKALGRAAARIAPLWPLRHYVAVNPFVGLADLPFVAAATRLRHVCGARLTMPRTWYAEALTKGLIHDEDLAAALAEPANWQTGRIGIDDLKRAAVTPERRHSALATVTETASFVRGIDWDQLAIDRISRWAASYFDEGQTAWRSPWRDLPPYTAWREEALLDRTPDLMELPGFRAVLATLPADADELIRLAVLRLRLDESALELWFHRLLMTIPGWAGYVRYRVWQSELRGLSDATLTGLLAIRLAWELGIHTLLKEDPEFDQLWTNAREAAASTTQTGNDDLVDSLLHRAYELGWQRRFAASLMNAPTPKVRAATTVQAAFCIDVRSEPLRRALEDITSNVQTIGFAGFFGIPIEYVRLGHECGTAHCPVLLKPRHLVCESLKNADATTHELLHESTRARRFLQKGWHSFKSGAVTSFGYVEALGWTYSLKLLTDALGLTRPQSTQAIDRSLRDIGTAPAVDTIEHAGREAGLSLDARVELAETLLISMSASRHFARLFMLTAHGASSVNNPYAASLDCGACGGHSGEANARIAAAILNDPLVRVALSERGIRVPVDTWFIAALHDTTEDTVQLLDEDEVPSTHLDDVRQLRQWLQAAGVLARHERSKRLADCGAARHADTARQRSRDWSQLRPELGLAGCAAFIAAPRGRTTGIDLGGRAFLHDYDWRNDKDFKTLEQIMTAPMIVASWIALQYFGSTVDNEHFGSGNKALHNVVGALGVVEGNGGDLRVGLPVQSLRVGERLLHEPLRLSVFIDAPLYAIDLVLDKHLHVWELVGNRWLHLFAFQQDTNVLMHYVPAHGWQPFSHASR